MEHVVFYPGVDGGPAFRRVGSLEDAVRLVEHLRNVEGVADVSVHALTEVPMAFRAYYRVEVPSSEPGPSATPEAPVAVVPTQGPSQAQPAAQLAPLEAPAPLTAVPQETGTQVAVDPTREATEPVAPGASPEPAIVGAELNGSRPSNGHREVTGLGFFVS